MTAHQRHIPLTEAFRQVAALRHIGYEQIGVAEFLANVPHRNLAADETAGMNHRLERRLDQPEWQGVLGMGVHNRHDVGSCLEYRRVDETLEIRLTLVVDGFPL